MSFGSVFDIFYMLIGGVLLLWIARDVLRGKTWRGTPLTRAERNISAGMLVTGTGIFVAVLILPIASDALVAAILLPTLIVGLVVMYRK